MYTVPQMHQQEHPTEAKTFPSLGTLAIETFRIWKSNWGIFTIINLFTVFTGAIAFIAITMKVPWIGELLQQGGNIDPERIATWYPHINNLIVDVSVVSLILISFIFCIIISQIMTVRSILPEMRQKGFFGMLTDSLHMIPRYVITLSLAGVIMAGGVALLFLPGILLLPLAMVIMFSCVIEGTCGMQAVEKGAHYIKGYIIETMWRMLSVLLIIQTVSLLLPLLATLIVYPFTLLDFSEHTIKILSFIAGTLYTFVSFVLSLILPSLLMIFNYQLFTHIRDNPVMKKPLSTHVLKVLAWIGIIFIFSIILLEVFGI